MGITTTHGVPISLCFNWAFAKNFAFAELAIAQLSFARQNLWLRESYINSETGEPI